MKKLDALYWIIFLTAAVILFCVIITWQLEKKISVLDIEPKAAQKTTTPIVEHKARELIVSDPKDFGMVVFDPGVGPSETEIDNMLTVKISQLKSNIRQETWNKIREKIVEDNQKTESKLAQIEESIKQCRDTLNINPNDAQIKAKLERLLMLKIIARDLLK
jgi:hypothetical protein